jgi:hypothetical protein
MTDLKLTPEQEKKVHIVKLHTAQMLASLMEAVGQKFSAEFGADVQIGLAMLAWPMIATGQKTADGRPAFAAVGEAMMVGNVNPRGDPDEIMKSMLLSAIKTLDGGAILRRKEPTKH